jgi:hypothetical protein
MTKETEIKYIKDTDSYLWDALKTEFGFTDEDRERMAENVRGDLPLFHSTPLEEIHSKVVDLENENSRLRDQVKTLEDSAKGYERENNNLRNQATEAALALLGRGADEAARKLLGSTEAVARLKVKHELPLLEDEKNIILERL